MKVPQNIQDVQRLVGKIMALSRFISRSADRSLPFFKVLWKLAKFSWDKKCDITFSNLKNYLEKLSILHRLKVGERLWIYLAAGEGAVSAVLLRQKKELCNILFIYLVIS